MPMRPNPCDERVHAESDHHEQAAEQIDCNVGVRIWISSVAGSEQIQHWFAEYQAEYGQKHTGNNHHGEGISHDRLGFFDIPASALN